MESMGGHIIYLNSCSVCSGELIPVNPLECDWQQLRLVASANISKLVNYQHVLIDEQKAFQKGSGYDCKQL